LLKHNLNPQNNYFVAIFQEQNIFDLLVERAEHRKRERLGQTYKNLSISNTHIIILSHCIQFMAKKERRKKNENFIQQTNAKRHESSLKSKNEKVRYLTRQSKIDHKFEG
jgi:hypothetical protein